MTWHQAGSWTLVFGLSYLRTLGLSNSWTIIFRTYRPADFGFSDSHSSELSGCWICGLSHFLILRLSYSRTFLLGLLYSDSQKKKCWFQETKWFGIERFSCIKTCKTRTQWECKLSPKQKHPVKSVHNFLICGEKQKFSRWSLEYSEWPQNLLHCFLTCFVPVQKKNL